jgi:hypothetical protein
VKPQDEAGAVGGEFDLRVGRPVLQADRVEHADHEVVDLLGEVRGESGGLDVADLDQGVEGLFRGVGDHRGGRRRRRPPR